MILFKEIKWRNFLSTGDVWSEINLNEHNSTLIIGDNGTGKSTVLDALTYALFNKPFRKINKPQLTNSINNKKMLVEVVFSIGTNEYKVRRGMKPGIFEIYKNDVMLPQDAKVGDYQYILEKSILKLNYKSFTQIVILGNSSFIPFMQLTSANRREVIEDLLDIQIFSLMNGLLKERIAKNKEEMNEINVQIEILKEKIKLVRKYINNMVTSNKNDIALIDEQLEASQKGIETHKKTIKEHQTRTDQLLTKITDSTKNKETIDELYKIQDTINGNLRRYKKTIAFFEDTEECPTCNQSIDAEFGENIVSERKTKVDESTKGLSLLEDKLEALERRQKKIFEIQSEINQLLTTINGENNSIEGLNNYITKLNTDKERLKRVKDDQVEEKKKLTGYINQQEQNENLHKDLFNTRSVHDLAYTLLKDGGVKTRIIKQYVPIMNKLINKYLSALDFFVGFELDEKFNEVIKSRNRDEFSYHSFSEGQKQRIDLALLFTWRSIARMKNSVSTNLLILDEIFDSSLDPNGCDEFMKLLHDLSSKANVFVISHKGEVLQDKFVNTIKFEEHKNFSRIAK